MGLGEKITEKNETIEKLEEQIEAPDPGEDDVPGRNLIFYMPYAELKGENKQ